MKNRLDKIEMKKGIIIIIVGLVCQYIYACTNNNSARYQSENDLRDSCKAFIIVDSCLQNCILYTFEMVQKRDEFALTYLDIYFYDVIGDNYKIIVSCYDSKDMWKSDGLIGISKFNDFLITLRGNIVNENIIKTSEQPIAEKFKFRMPEEYRIIDPIVYHFKVNDHIAYFTRPGSAGQ